MGDTDADRHLKLVAGLGFVGIFFAVVAFPYLANHRSDTRRVACAENLRLVGRGCLLYMADWDEKLPSDTWLSSIAGQKYIGEAIRSGAGHTIQSTVKCPAAGRYGYAMLLDAVGRQLSAIPAPEQTVLVFETDDLRANVAGDKKLLAKTRHTHLNYLLATGTVESRLPKIAGLKWSLPPLAVPVTGDNTIPEQSSQPASSNVTTPPAP